MEEAEPIRHLFREERGTLHSPKSNCPVVSPASLMDGACQRSPYGLPMSPYGPKQPWATTASTSPFESKADAAHFRRRAPKAA